MIVQTIIQSIFVSMNSYFYISMTKYKLYNIILQVVSSTLFLTSSALCWKQIFPILVFKILNYK